MRPTLSRWRDYLTVSGAKLAATAVVLVFSVASARMLGPDGRGEFVTVTTTVSLGTQILNFGMSSALLLAFSRSPAAVPPTLARSWIGAGGLALALGLIGFSASRGLADPPAALRAWWGAIALWIPVQLLGLYHGAAVTALGRVGLLSVVELGGRLLAAAAGLLALLWFGALVSPVVFAVLLAEATTVAAIFGYLRLGAGAPGSSSGQRPVALRDVLPLALRAYPLLLLPFALIKADLLLVTAIRGATEAGIYSIAGQIVDLMLVLPGVAAAVALPDVVRAKSPQAAALRLAREVAVICLVLALVAALVAPYVIPLLFGQAFVDASLPFRLLLPGYVLLAVETAAVQYMATRGFPISVSAIWLVAVVLNLALNAIAIPRYGAVGAAVVSSLSYGFVAVLVLRQVLRVEDPSEV